MKSGGRAIGREQGDPQNFGRSGGLMCRRGAAAEEDGTAGEIDS